MTLNTVADESRKNMADGVARSQSRLCSRDGKICCYGGALSTIFLLVFVPCFLLFVFRFRFRFLIFFPASPVWLSSCLSSVQQSATLSMYVIRSSTYYFCLCHLCPTPSRNSLVFYSFSIFFVTLIPRVEFFCCALVPGTLALDLPTLIL